MRTRRVGAILAAMLIVAACSPSTPSSSAPSAGASSGAGGSAGASPDTQPSTGTGGGGTIVVADYKTVDAAWAPESDDSFLLTNMGVGEGLTRTDFDGLLQPSLGTEWTRTGDLTWDVTIRDGVTFHDGTPLDAAAVAGALTHVLDAATPARSFNKSTFASVTASAPNVVTITTVGPNALVPYFLASPNAIILAPKAYAGDAIDPVEAGTGPFVMTSTNLPESVTLTKNASYWGGPVSLDGAEYRFIPDGGTRTTLVQSGQANIATSLPIASLPTLEADSNVKVIRETQSRTGSLYMNNKKAPFTDIRVRQAIQAAIDVDAIANSLLEGAAAPGVGPFAANAAWAPAGAAPLTRDLEKAKSLLAEAGIQPGSLTLGLWAYPSRPELPDIAVAIQGMLVEIGINTEVRVADYAALEPDVLAGNFDMMLLTRGYVTDINDPIAYLRSDYTCDGSFNLSHFCDPAVDAQLADALGLEDANARYAIYSELATRLQTDAVDVFLYHPPFVHGTTPNVQNYKIHPLEHFYLTPELALGS